MSIIKHVTLQKIVAHDFRYDPRITVFLFCFKPRSFNGTIPLRNSTSLAACDAYKLTNISERYKTFLTRPEIGILIEC